MTDHVNDEYPDDELDSIAPGRRDAVADEAARAEDQAVPHVVHLGSNSALANELNAQFNQITVSTVANLTSIARHFGQPLRVTPAVRSEILRVVNTIPPGSHAAVAMPDPVDVIPVDDGSANVVYDEATSEWVFLKPGPRRWGWRGYVTGSIGATILVGVTDDGRDWAEYWGALSPDQPNTEWLRCACCPRRAQPVQAALW